MSTAVQSRKRFSPAYRSLFESGELASRGEAAFRDSMTTPQSPWLEFQPGYLPMLDAELLKSVASQLMTRTSVDVEGESAPVRRTSRQRLKTVAFSVDGHQYQAIEQNLEKPSRWGQLARSGHQVVQFKDAERNKFVAVVVDGEIRFYGASKRRS
jgi:hypothetical protein